MTTSAYLWTHSTFSGPWSCWMWYFGFSLPNSYSPSAVMKQPLPDTFSQLLPKTFLHLEPPILPRFPFLISRNLYFGYAVPFLFVCHGNWPTHLVSLSPSGQEQPSLRSPSSCDGYPKGPTPHRTVSTTQGGSASFPLNTAQFPSPLMTLAASVRQ